MPSLSHTERCRSRTSTARLASILTIAALIAVGCSSHQPQALTTRPSPASSTPANALPTTTLPTTTLPTTTLPTRVIAEHPSLGAGLPLLTGFGYVWSASAAGLIRFTTRGKARKVLDTPVRDIAIAARSVVVLLDRTPELLSFDPTTLRSARRWRLPGPGGSVTTDGSTVYAVEGSAPARITRLDLSTGAMASRVLPLSDTPAADRSIALGAGSLWFADQSAVIQLDPSNLATVRSIASPISPSSIWFGDSAIWVSSDAPDGGIFRLDPDTAKITTNRRTDAIQIAFTPQRVWLAAAAGATAVLPTTGQLVGSIPAKDVLDDSSAGIAVVGPDLWVAYENQGIVQVLRI